MLGGGLELAMACDIRIASERAQFGSFELRRGMHSADGGIVRLVNTCGVYSVEVEAALAQHPAVAMAAIIGVPDATWGEKVTAYIVLAPGTTATEAELQQHCHERLAKYKAPKAIHFETALPMTPSGKIQKAILRERARART